MEVDSVSSVARSICGYTRGEIARGTGLSLSHVSRIFGQKRVPSVGVMRRLAEFLKIGIDELMSYIKG